jgi:hypothetical protein
MKKFNRHFKKNPHGNNLSRLALSLYYYYLMLFYHIKGQPIKENLYWQVFQDIFQLHRTLYKAKYYANLKTFMDALAFYDEGQYENANLAS